MRISSTHPVADVRLPAPGHLRDLIRQASATGFMLDSGKCPEHGPANVDRADMIRSLLAKAGPDGVVHPTSYAMSGRSHYLLTHVDQVALHNALIPSHCATIARPGKQLVALSTDTYLTGHVWMAGEHELVGLPAGQTRATIVAAIRPLVPLLPVGQFYLDTYLTRGEHAGRTLTYFDDTRREVLAQTANAVRTRFPNLAAYVDELHVHGSNNAPVQRATADAKYAIYAAAARAVAGAATPVLVTNHELLFEVDPANVSDVITTLTTLTVPTTVPLPVVVTGPARRRCQM